MTLCGEAILAGPRGRRVCLELATDLEPAIHSAVFRLVHGREPAGGGFVSINRIRDHSDPYLISALDKLSAAISSLDLSDLDSRRILVALGRAVDSAMYWQPPDGEDELAGHPIIRSALAPVAECLASSPRMDWFVEPRRAEQWAIDWRSENAWPPLPKDPQKTLGEWTGKDGSEVGAGAWWSIPLGLVQTIGHLPAALSLVEDSLGWKQATAIPVRGGGRTFEVRSAEDWVSLCRDFPHEVTATRQEEWLLATGRDGRWVIPDWARVAHEWDAVHLTVMAYLSSATRALQVDADTASVIAGWDPGRTIWLTDVVAESDAPRQDWSLDGADDTWIRKP